MSDKPGIPTGRLERFLRLTSLSSTVSASVLGQKVKSVFQAEEDRAKDKLKNQIRNAERVVETMGHLKGAVMKVGQMMSLHDGAGMPREISSILSRLQSQAPPLSYEQIREQIMSALERPPEELFREFSREPMAGASLGQVHRALLKDGTRVAVKVQYPGIANTIDSDLRNLRTIIDATGVVSSRFDTEGIYQEIKTRLHEEIDYVQEAINLEDFRRFFSDDSRVVIPRYYPEYSCETVLTMELIEGLTTQEMLASGLSQEERNQLGLDLFDIHLKQLLRFQTIHADPHHGNYLFLPGGRVCLLDFGCVKRFERYFTESYKELTRAALAHDRRKMVDCLVEIGYLSDDGNPVANDLLCDISLLFIAPMLRDEEFAFGPSDLHTRGRQFPRRFMSLGKMTFPPDALYLNRVFIGLYFLLRKLEARGNWQKVVKPYLAR